MLHVHNIRPPHLLLLLLLGLLALLLSGCLAAGLLLQPQGSWQCQAGYVQVALAAVGLVVQQAARKALQAAQLGRQLLWKIWQGAAAGWLPVDVPVTAAAALLRLWQPVLMDRGPQMKARFCCCCCCLGCALSCARALVNLQHICAGMLAQVSADILVLACCRCCCLR
jgi:hypothetical protein